MIVLISVPSSLIKKTAMKFVWLALSQFQLLILLPMVGAFMTNPLIDFCADMSFTLFSFNFIPIKDIAFINDLIDSFDYQQIDTYLEKTKLKSLSTIINGFSIL